MRKNAQQRTWGLVLSGGAAWGLANGGVLEVLDREGLKPDYIAGSSMGAIVASVYAMGHPASALLELAGKLKITTLAKLSASPLKGGLHGGILQQQLALYLEPLLKNAVIGDCKIPFVCVAGKVKKPILWQKSWSKTFVDTVFDAVEPYVFPAETRIMDAILASSAIPVLFSPAPVEKDTFVDLLNFGAIPARTLRATYQPDIVIATDTAPRHIMAEKMLPAGMKLFLEAGNKSLEESRKACDLIIEPAMPAPYYRFDRAMAFLEAGREATEQSLPAIRQLLANH